MDKEGTDFNSRFVDSEKWRKEFGLDELVRHFDYPEKAKVFEYYPQYYHKTDIVRCLSPCPAKLPLTARRMVAHSTSSSSAKLTSQQCALSQVRAA